MGEQDQRLRHPARVTMRAVVCDSFDGYRTLKARDIPAPTLRPGCVRISVAYATAGLALTLVTAGRYQRKPALPFVPGTEIAGVVTELADNIQELRRGDRVAANIDWGGYAEEAIAATENVWRVPDAVELSDACCVPATYGTAYAALHWRARVAAGQTVLVFGAAGGVGLAAVQIARQAGAHVIAVARTADRLAIAREHGAHEGLLNDTPDLGRQLKQHNAGRGVDVVFDPVGGPLFEEALRCTAPEGRILLIGFASGEIPRIAANILLVKNIEVIGVNMGLYSGWTPVDERKRHAPRVTKMVEQLFAEVAAGRLKPQKSAVFALNDVVHALDAVAARESRGRVLLRVGGADPLLLKEQA